MKWTHHYADDKWYLPISTGAGGNGGAVTSAGDTVTVGDLGVAMVYVPDSISLSVTEMSTFNADTTTDASLLIRMGIYEVSDDMELTDLVVDAGTLTKNNSSTTTRRSPSNSPFAAVTLVGGNTYAFVCLVEALKVGATNGFDAYRENIWVPGAIGDNSQNDWHMGKSAISTNHPATRGLRGIATGGLPADLTSEGVPIPLDLIMPATYFYVDAVT